MPKQSVVTSCELIYINRDMGKMMHDIAEDLTKRQAEFGKKWCEYPAVLQTTIQTFKRHSVHYYNRASQLEEGNLPSEVIE